MANKKTGCLTIIIPVLAFTLFAPRFSRAQGPLTPPGAPAPTMKTLQQVEPRTPITNLPVTITQPGSYYLTGNLTCSACTNSQSGITLSTGNVSIDLNGFALQGVPGSVNGITAFGALTNCIVRNGSVNGWGYDGISLFISGPIPGGGGLVLDCSLSSNGRNGISAAQGCVVRNCSPFFNGAVGIAATYSTVSDCTAYSNGGDGIEGSYGRISDCTSTFNKNAGINPENSTVSGCIASLIGGYQCHSQCCHPQHVGIQRRVQLPRAGHSHPAADYTLNE